MLSTLDRLNVGESGIVTQISGEENIKRRLLDIGLIRGMSVDCILTSPLLDPKAYWIKGTLIAIRKDDAKNIAIEVM